MTSVSGTRSFVARPLVKAPVGRDGGIAGCKIEQPFRGPAPERNLPQPHLACRAFPLAFVNRPAPDRQTLRVIAAVGGKLNEFAIHRHPPHLVPPGAARSKDDEAAIGRRSHRGIGFWHRWLIVACLCRRSLSAKDRAYCRAPVVARPRQPVVIPQPRRKLSGAAWIIKRCHPNVVGAPNLARQRRAPAGRHHRAEGCQRVLK